MAAPKVKPGRPIVLTPCPWCKREMGAAKLRNHLPKCSKRPK